MVRQTTLAIALSLLVVNAASAACVNKFVSRTEGSARQVVTLLTGKLTFQEAQALAASIRANQAPPLEWVDEKGHVLAKQFGEIKVVRPMPVGCDGKASGVVVIVAFGSVVQPSKVMHVRIDSNTTIAFEQQ